jgi:hypothetical protein
MSNCPLCLVISHQERGLSSRPVCLIFFPLILTFSPEGRRKTFLLPKEVLEFPLPKGRGGIGKHGLTASWCWFSPRGKSDRQGVLTFSVDCACSLT